MFDLVFVFKLWITFLIISILGIIVEEGLRPNRSKNEKIVLAWRLFGAFLVVMDIGLLFVLSLMAVWL